MAYASAAGVGTRTPNPRTISFYDRHGFEVATSHLGYLRKIPAVTPNSPRQRSPSTALNKPSQVQNVSVPVYESDRNDHDWILLADDKKSGDSQRALSSPTCT